jgi:hypothetical protein
MMQQTPEQLVNAAIAAVRGQVLAESTGQRPKPAPKRHPEDA